MDLQPIKLSKGQEIENINFDVADNGGAVLRYTIYSPKLTNKESSWDSKMEVFDGDEMDTELLNRISELFKVAIQAKRISHQKKGMDGEMPMMADHV